jgi:hypothetical protein
MGNQPLLAFERTVERVPGRWPLSSQALAAEGGGRKARLYKGQASVGCDSRPRARATRALHHPFEVQKSPNFTIFLP